MQIILDNCGRRFNQEWIFRNCSLTLLPRETYAILGKNGSGKSTLMHVLSGTLSPSEGTVKYLGEKQIPEEDIYRSISFTAPYIDLIEEFTLKETIDFHFRFKNYHTGVDYNTLLGVLGLNGSENKQLKNFSSGMKQRTRLALAFCSKSAALLLDEPTSNLDTQGIDWYLSLTERFLGNRLFIVASNQEHEYGFCQNFISISDYKQV